MHRRVCIWPIALLILFLGAMVDAAAVSAQGECSITGRVSLTDPEGTVFHGDWVRVYLTTEAVSVPEVDLASVDIALERRSRINTGQMDFFVNFQRKQSDPAYLVDHKLTRPDGTFAFHGIPAGRYWVLVTFPTMIAGYKCAWQTPVEVAEGQDAHVILGSGNLAIPAY